MSDINENYICEVADLIKQEAGASNLRIKGVDTLFNIYAVLAMSKGCEVTDEDVHDAWAAWASQYNRDDESIVPFEELSKDIQALDSKYTKAIRKIACKLPEYSEK